MAGIGVAPRRKLRRGMKGAIRSGQERRLEPLLPEQHRELERLSASASGEGWHREAAALLADAEHALREGCDPTTAWQAYLASSRAMVGGYDVHSIAAKAIELRHEAAAKVSSWRRRGIEDALKLATDPAQSLEAKRVALAKAWSLRDEEMQSRYFRLEELKRQLLTVGAVLLVAIVGTLISLGRANLDMSKPPPTSRASLWALIVLFGMLGGSISAFQGISRQRSGDRIPEQLTQSAIAVLRPLIGAASALGAGVLLAAGVITFASNTAAAVLGVAFAAGFSERLVTRAVSSISGTARTSAANESRAQET